MAIIAIMYEKVSLKCLVYIHAYIGMYVSILLEYSWLLSRHHPWVGWVDQTSPMSRNFMLRRVVSKPHGSVCVLVCLF